MTTCAGAEEAMLMRGSKDEAVTSTGRFESAPVERFVFIGNYLS